MSKTYSDKLKSPKWQKKRLEIMERDGFQCQCCFDRDKTLTVHHKWYTDGYEPWDYFDSCYITLCEDCHESVHLWEKHYKNNPELYTLIPFSNITNLRILCERMYEMERQQGKGWIKNAIALLTSQIIRKEDI